jgi:hypothetical protein
LKFAGKNFWPLYWEICRGLSLGFENFEVRFWIVGKFRVGVGGRKVLSEYFGWSRGAVGMGLLAYCLRQKIMIAELGVVGELL